MNDKYINNIIIQIEKFWGSNLRNSWLENKGIQVYVRKSKRSVNQETYEFLDIANITVVDKGKKFLTKMLDILEPNYNIYVESILEERLIPFLSKRLYTLKDNTDMFKFKTENEK